MTIKAVRILGLVMLAAMGLFVATRLEVSTEITRFLPPSEDEELASLLEKLLNSELNRRIVLSISAPDLDTAVTASSEMVDLLQDCDEIASLQTGPTETFESVVHDMFYPRRFFFLSDRPEEELYDLFSDAGLAEAAQRLRRELVRPMSPLIRQWAPTDPFLAFMGILERLKAMRPDGLTVRDGQLVSSVESRAFIFITSTASPFDTRRGGVLLGEIDSAFSTVNDRYDSLLLEQSSIHRFALSSERSMRNDLTRISVFSMVCVTLLVVMVFGSIRYLLLGLVPLAAGLLSAMTFGTLVFGDIHGLTLAFGASLIGVCIDYPIHLFNHHTLNPVKGGAEASLRRIWTGLLLGAGTTVIGFSGFAWASYPGLREFAVFAAVGVVAALVATRLFLPPLMPTQPRTTALQRWLSQWLGRLIDKGSRAKWVLAAPAIALAVVIPFGLNALEWNDNFQAMNALDPEILEEDQRVRAAVSSDEASQLVVALGANEEEALEGSDEAYRLLVEARGDGLVEDFRSVNDVIWSASLQRRNRRIVDEHPDLAQRMLAALDAAGFDPIAFEGFADELSLHAQPLTFADIEDSPLGLMLSPFRVELEDEVAFLAFVRGVSDPQEFAARFTDQDKVFYLDQRVILSSLGTGIRSRTVELICIGLLVVFLTVLLRYRRLRPTLAAFLPALLAAGATMALFGAIGVQVNLMHAVCLLLVLSIGIDYGVFLAEGRGDGEMTSATMLSITMACLSTVASFGVLALSDNPALRAIGATVGIGVILSLILSPIGLLLSQSALKSEGEP